MTNQRLRISLSDLPARARPLGEDAIAKIFGGCVGEGQECRVDWDCCSITMNNTGSGGFKLACVGNSSNNVYKVCDWVNR